ncbi:hypothetical protein P872_13555 [Rhodonellum psychrophilum GCM71 = DSM 17998]|uniref:Uncharacterized protein n=1 Tax=Rhodonellum psychrophilum GCM71 = DSM 17998 TaxID=1123057 RepID=U5BUY5_9BACT|nr:hypothetical protein P872_13555 [Rhodonellum psychrophilum GCM71 = DSM 17998]
MIVVQKQNVDIPKLTLMDYILDKDSFWLPFDSGGNEIIPNPKFSQFFFGLLIIVFGNKAVENPSFGEGFDQMCFFSIGLTPSFESVPFQKVSSSSPITSFKFSIAMLFYHNRDLEKSPFFGC